MAVNSNVYVPQRTEAVPFDDVPGQLPAPSKVPTNVDLDDIAAIGLDLINRLGLDKKNISETVIWRDLLALTGTYRTFFSANKVVNTWLELSTKLLRSQCRQTDRPPRLSMSPNQQSSWYDVDFDFSTTVGGLVGQGSGTVSITTDDNGGWYIWMIRTWLESFEGHGHPDLIQPRSQDITTSPDSSTYDVVIIGGGQNGLSIAGRLQALGLRYVLLEKHPLIGDNWRTRYDSLSWHTVKEFGELPFGRTFHASDPYFVPAKRIGSAYEAWANKHGLNTRTRAEVKGTVWSEATRSWTVQVDEGGEIIEYKTRNVVLAIGGVSTEPFYPPWATPPIIADSGFQGTILHATQYRRCENAWAGQRGIVVGTATTAHDIAEDMLKARMEVTMLQRSPTYVIPIEYVNHGLGMAYNQNVPTERADRMVDTMPLKIGREMINQGLHGAIAAHPDRFDALEKVGFRLDRFGDLHTHLFVRSGGHYPDVGTSAKIAEGKIKVRPATVKTLTTRGIEFGNGSRLDADVIVLCTGFQPDFRKKARKILGDVADVMDDFPGVDKEGEVRSQAKFAGHPQLYYLNGDTRSARWDSRFVALQIQADLLGSKLPLYTSNES